jgi:HEAT repeat protein
LKSRNNDLDGFLEGLNSSNPDAVEFTIKRLSLELEAMKDAEYRRAVDALCSLFYVDTSDRPDLQGAVDHATDLLAGQGSRVVHLLLDRMEESDIKSHLYLARILGRIGLYALQPLRDLLASSDDAYSRSFALYALGKMTCPEVAAALPEVLGGLERGDREVLDTAARTLGRMVQAVGPELFSADDRERMFQALLKASRFEHAAVRAKAIRSLGKMAGRGLLDREQKGALSDLLHGTLGASEEAQWDRAFIVRKEAKEALASVERS